MRSLLYLCLAAATLSAPASAALITTVPMTSITWVLSGETTTTEAGPGSRTIEGFHISWDGPAGIAYQDNWGLGANGYWTIALLGDNEGTTFITIDLGAEYATAGGWVNYARGERSQRRFPYMIALATDGSVLESHNLFDEAPITGTSGSLNEGAFRAIALPTASIRYLRFGGDYMALNSWTIDSTPSVSASPVPEPSTLLLAAAGLLGAALLRRRSA